MFRDKLKSFVGGVCAWAANELRSAAPKDPGEENEYRVAVINGDAPIEIEVVRATSLEQAAERAANAFAHRRLTSTNERSWRLKALVSDSLFEVCVSCYLHAEICSK